MGTVAATCSGQKHHADDDFDEDKSELTPVTHDTTLKVWSMPFLDTHTAG